MNTWKLIYNKFNQDEEPLRESLCTLGNGYLGTRGAAPETSANKVHYPGTYIAGVYNTLPSDVAGRTIHNEDFVNCPNWLMFNVRIDNGQWFNRLHHKVLTWKVELNMRKGMLSRRVRWQDEQGRITLIENHRIVSMAHPHMAALRCTVTPENYDGEITFRSGVDGLIINAGVDRYKQLNSNHLIPSSHGEFGEDGIFLQMETTESQVQIATAMRNLVFLGHEQVSPELKVIAHGRQRIMHECTLKASKGQRLTMQKLVSVYTSRDHGVADPIQMAQEAVGQTESFEALYKAHQAKWKALWSRFDIELQGDDFAQLALRLHAFHLLQSASTYNEDIDAGMPVRGLHGEAYRGHIFWDELYVFPFYNLHAPEITRALLMYRYRRLGAAKENAAEHGFRGAMYPWQTASKGDEQSQVIHLNPMSNTWGPDYSSLQRHVSVAVAYNVWNYYYTTGDRDFLNRYGMEMILEIALFWSTIATFNKQTGRYDIDGVMGPDEFHEKYPASNNGGIKNNAYTNVLAVWVISKALYILDEMINEEDKNAILLKIGITEEDLERWRDITHKMAIPMDKNGLIHQFEGYMELDELDWEDYRSRYDNIHRVDRILKSEGLSPDSFKVAKQADVLMIFYILNEGEIKSIFKKLGYPYPKDTLRKNFDQYYPRTSHGSTLSMVVHAHLQHLLGSHDELKDTFNHALRSDLHDTQGGTTQEGIHAGVMGSTMDLFLRIYAGLNILDDRISLNPYVPEEWSSFKFQIRYKDMWYIIKITKDSISLLLEPLDKASASASAKVPVDVRKKIHQIVPGKPYTISTRQLFII